jgi:hypothetical protein
MAGREEGEVSPVAMVFPGNGETQCKRMRDLPHRSHNETLRSHTMFSVKLSETVAEFVHKLSSVEDQHAQQLNNLARNFRRKTQETFRKDPSIAVGTQFSSWEAMLKDTEEEAKLSTELSRNLVQGIAAQIQELTSRKKMLLKKWFLFRETYMCRIDKTEDKVNKVFREYQDNWNKYAESLEKDAANVKEMVVLHSYNSHNEYILQKTAFNSLHDEFYGRQVYDMLDELQAIHEDLVKGLKTSMHKCGEMMRTKAQKTCSHLTSFVETVSRVNASEDTSELVNRQDLIDKAYPPPPCKFRPPDLPPPKLPDSPPVDLPSLPDQLSLNDLTQSPLGHSREAIKQTEFAVSGALERLHKEYQSVKSLLDSYRDNPTLGDPNTLIEELLEMRNKIRVKEAELVMIRAKLNMFMSLVEAAPPEMSFQLSSPIPPPSGHPRKSAAGLVSGRDHDFVESEKRRPALCAYCGGMIQPPISKGVKCRSCKMNLHHRCQNSVPYCHGTPPTKPASKSAAKAVSKRISQILTRKSSADPHDTASNGSFDEDEGDGVYEPPPPPLPRGSSDKRTASLSPAPEPPPRGESLDPENYARLDAVQIHNSFEDTLELGDSSSYCVALFEYACVNPNDLHLQPGDVIELINTSSSDWWKGSCRARVGYFPATYVQAVSTGNQIFMSQFDFAAEGQGELPLLEGQIVVILRDNQDGWLYGRSGTEEGLFPGNYTKRLTTV